MVTPGFDTIDTLFFDLGFTLINFEGDFYLAMAESYRVLANSLVRQGCKLDPAAFTTRFQEVISQYYISRESDLVERPVDGYLKNVLSEFGLRGIRHEILQTSLADMYAVTQAYWQLESDTLPTLDKLSSMGFKLGLITNAANPEDANHLIDKHGLRVYFKTILISACERIRKPDARIFHRALERIDSTAAQSAMVGDTLTADIAGAQRVGMKGIWLPRRAGGRGAPAMVDMVTPDLVIETLSELPGHLQ
jgi:putative hydrolase of the HAD superfamily